MKSKGAKRVSSPKEKKTRNFSTIDSKFSICLGKVVLDLPIRTVSEANCFQRWQVKYARHKAQKELVSLSLNGLKGKIPLPCAVKLTRFAPHELDAFDNLPSSFKYIVDAICEVITGNYTPGRADGDKRINISCTQVKSEAYGIRIEIEY